MPKDVRPTPEKDGQMEWTSYLAYFFGGALLANAVPHFVSGVMGRRFQSPFAKPPGKGLSSSTVNVLWGFFNFVASYVLISRVGNFDIHAFSHAGMLGLGALLMAIMLARTFGQYHGGLSADSIGPVQTPRPRDF
jgi:hypothetical protein